MGNTPVIKTRKISPSSHSKLPDSFIYQPRESRIESNVKRHRIFTISHFLYLIVITSVVFCAGGFGFGVALRYGQTWQNSNVLATDNPISPNRNYQ